MSALRGRVVFAAVLGVAAVSVGVLAAHVNGPDVSPSVSPVEATSPEQPESTVRVHVSGMVVAPGVVDVMPDAIVADAIDAAGGLRPGALVDQINLAATVAAGDQIIVPGPADDDDSGSEDGGAGGGLISLNRATAPDLETLPGVGPVLADRIVAFREQNGRFETVEDLLEVPGIGEAKLAALRDLVRP